MVLKRNKYQEKRRTKLPCLVLSILIIFLMVSCGCVSDDENEPNILIFSNFSSPYEISEDLFDFKLQPSKSSNPLTFPYDIIAKDDIKEFKFYVFTYDKGKEDGSICRVSKEVTILGIEKGEERSDKIELSVVSIFEGEIYDIYTRIEAIGYDGEKITTGHVESLNIEGDISDQYRLNEWEKHIGPMEISIDDKSIDFQLEWWINKTRIKEDEEISIVCKTKKLYYNWDKKYVIVYILLCDDQEVIVDSKGFALGLGSNNVRITKFSTRKLEAGKEYFVCIAWSYEEEKLLKYSEKAQIIGESTEIRVFSS